MVTAAFPVLRSHGFRGFAARIPVPAGFVPSLTFLDLPAGKHLENCCGNIHKDVLWEFWLQSHPCSLCCSRTFFTFSSLLLLRVFSRPTRTGFFILDGCSKPLQAPGRVLGMCSVIPPCQVALSPHPGGFLGYFHGAAGAWMAFGGSGKAGNQGFNPRFWSSCRSRGKEGAVN